MLETSEVERRVMGKSNRRKKVVRQGSDLWKLKPEDRFEATLPDMKGQPTQFGYLGSLFSKVAKMDKPKRAMNKNVSEKTLRFMQALDRISDINVDIEKSNLL